MPIFYLSSRKVAYEKITALQKKIKVNPPLNRPYSRKINYYDSLIPTETIILKQT